VSVGHVNDISRKCFSYTTVQKEVSIYLFIFLKVCIYIYMIYIFVEAPIQFFQDSLIIKVQRTAFGVYVYPSRYII